MPPCVPAPPNGLGPHNGEVNVLARPSVLVHRCAVAPPLAGVAMARNNAAMRAGVPPLRWSWWASRSGASPIPLKGVVQAGLALRAACANPWPPGS